MPQGLELELDSLSMERAVLLLEGLASMDTSRREGRQEVAREAWGRARPVARETSREDWSGLAEVQELARALACLARTGGLPPGSQLERLWDLARAGDSTLATNKVNRARRFLHSSASSGSSQEREQFPGINLHLAGEGREEERGSEGFVTPPESLMSQGSSMASCDGGRNIFLVAGHPTQVGQHLLSCPDSPHRRTGRCWRPPVGCS